MINAVLKTKNLFKSFPSFAGFSKVSVLKGISFSLKKGEIFGFLGPNGTGKTTTIKILVGLLNPDKGNVEILGGSPKNKNIRKKIGFLPEQPYFYEHLTGYEFLKFTGKLYDIPDKVLKERIRILLERVGLESAKDKRIRTYSRGMLQRIGIANALLSDPEILILDEPFTGLDPVGRKEMKDLVYEQKEKGKTIFFSSHILPDAEAICDRVGVIVNGEIIKIGPLEKILNERVKRYEIILKNVNSERLKKAGYDVYLRGDEAIIYVQEIEIEKTLKEIFEKFKEIKIQRVAPEIYSLEEWFVKILEEK